MLCYGNPESMVFIKDVLSYVMDLFPSKYVHIGGDEAEKSQWKAYQKCQAKIRELGFVDDQISTKEDKLQRHLTIELSKIISSKGKEMIGWSEIAHGEKVENSIVMSWLRNKNNEMPEKDNYTVILTPTNPMYLDYLQEKRSNLNTLDKVYNYEPITENHNDNDVSRFMGIEACMWTEYTPTFESVMTKVLPRAAAVSVAQWSFPNLKNYQSFLGDLENLKKIYELNNYVYYADY